MCRLLCTAVKRVPRICENNHGYRSLRGLQQEQFAYHLGPTTRASLRWFEVDEDKRLKEEMKVERN